MGLNQWTGIGHLGAAPETRYTKSSTAVTNFRIAISERTKDASGQWTEHTEWVRVVTFGKTAENCAQFLDKGRQVCVVGKLRTRKWQDKDGRDNYSTEIVADRVEFLSKGEGGSRRDDRGDSGGYDSRSNDSRGGPDDSDIPF